MPYRPQGACDTNSLGTMINKSRAVEVFASNTYLIYLIYYEIGSQLVQ